MHANSHIVHHDLIEMIHPKTGSIAKVNETQIIEYSGMGYIRKPLPKDPNAKKDETPSAPGEGAKPPKPKKEKPAKPGKGGKSKKDATAEVPADAPPATEAPKTPTEDAK